VAGHPQPHHITVGGREAVALTLREYEQLLANRRQIGGQSARIRALSEQVRKSRLLVGALEELVEGGPSDCLPHGTAEASACPAPCPARPATGRKDEEECLRGVLASLLRRHREGAI
jgi:hypothetical protein